LIGERGVARKSPFAVVIEGATDSASDGMAAREILAA